MTAVSAAGSTARGSTARAAGSPTIRICLGVLTLVQTVIGLWALIAPAAFYSGFPAAGHAWVAMLPPYNEHLVRDVGALSLALAVLLAAALVSAERRLVIVAVSAYSVYALPHTAFHGLHLEGFSRFDAAAQMAGFAFQLLLVAGVLWALGRDRGRPSGSGA